MNTEELSALVDGLTRLNGGCTVDVNGESPTDGYMVGGYVPTVIIPRDQFTQGDVAKFITEHAAKLAEAGSYIGTWVNEDSVYIDLSKRFTLLSDALIIGGKHGELAIWSVAMGKEISL